MTRFMVRRALASCVTLLGISFIVFALLELSPADPVGNLPLTIPPEVRAQIRDRLGADDPFLLKYLKWLRQFMLAEPLNLLEAVTGYQLPDSVQRVRVLSWHTHSPVMDIIAERLPQTLWVVGTAYLLGILVAVPIGVWSAYRPYSRFDQIASLMAIVGYSTPTFFTGLVLIMIFSVQLKWLPSIYDTTLQVNSLSSLWQQVRQMIMPVSVLSLFYTAQISRFTRSALLDHLHQDYIRTARAKGLPERAVIWRHALRNSLVPVVTLVALGLPRIFGGAIITEQIFRVNGLGQYMVIAINNGDLPTVQTLTVIFAALIIAFNWLADVIYALLDPRVVY